MKNYSMFTDGKSDVIATKNGWSWPAFCFGWIWALVKKLYLVGILIILISLMCYALIPCGILIGPNTVAGIVIGQIGLLSLIAIPIVLGIIGNKLLKNRLIKNGYQCVEVVIAENQGQAVLNYRNRKAIHPIDNTNPVQPTPMAPAPVVAQSPLPYMPNLAAVPSLIPQALDQAMAPSPAPRAPVQADTPPPLPHVPAPTFAPPPLPRSVSLGNESVSPSAVLGSRTTQAGKAMDPIVLEQLEKLASMKERGILTEDEFSIQKKNLLGV